MLSFSHDIGKLIFQYVSSEASEPDDSVSTFRLFTHSLDPSFFLTLTHTLHLSPSQGDAMYLKITS